MKEPKEVEKKVSSKRDSESLDDLVKSLPLPKNKPRAEQKGYIIAEDQEEKRIKTIAVGTIVNKCQSAINDYSLKELVGKAKDKKFRNLTDPEKELLTAGLIQLGEALTFCRDKRSMMLAERIGIVNAAESYANARNHFVHHQLYHKHLYEGSYSKAEEFIEKLHTIEILERKLLDLQKSGLDEISKPIRMGENKFGFEYSHFIACLKAEFVNLKRILEIPDCLNKINSDKELKALLNNGIRNILVIMIDLTDENSTNQNRNDPSCSAQKATTKNFNKEFRGEFKQFAGLFANIKEYRNSLCHLDDSLEKPYNDNKEMLEFAKNLLNLEKLGYVSRLENQFLHEHKKEPVKQDEKKEEIPKNIPDRVECLTGYDSEKEKKQEPQTPTITSTPRMGGH